MRKFVSFVFAFSILLTSQLPAAAPVMHAYLAERFFRHFPKYNKEEKHAFMVGTLFPDIRYLGKVMRDETHCEHVSLEEVIAEPSPFMAGLKFHSYVDWVREDFVIENEMYRLLGTLSEDPQEMLYLKLKLLEDEIVYPKRNWKEWVEALQEIHPEELNWGMELETIRKWHFLLTMCLTHPPSALIFLLTLANVSYLNIPAEQLAGWNEAFSYNLQDENVRDFGCAMLHHFEHTFEKMHAY